MTYIYCLKNKGYKWRSENGIYFKGYLQNNGSKKEIFREEEAIEYFSEITSFELFLEKLKNIDGIYSVICYKDETVWAAVDIARSIPIYFSENGEYVSDSSECIREKTNVIKENIDRLRTLEMMNTGYVAHNNTIYNKIKQLDLGQAVEIRNGQINIQTYYYHYNLIIKNSSRNEIMKELQKTSENAFDNIIKIIDGRPIVLSLSGGYDSKYVACMLKSRGIENVSCYTYGAASSFEIEHAKTVADSLGYRWICVEYTDKKIRSILSDENLSYFDFCNEHDFTIYLQNYIAVKELHQKGWFYPGSVFLTGLCNDMASGAYVELQEKVTGYPISNQGVVEYIYDKKFVRYQLDSETKKVIIKEIMSKIDLLEIDVSSYQSFVSVVDCITTGYDHSRRFLPMNQVHAYFGYEWLLPCWSKELLNFWYSVPVKYRVNQNLYEDWLINDLCAKYGLGTTKVVLTHSNIDIVTFLKRLIGGFLVRIFYPLGLSLRRKTDQNNFAVLEVLLYKQINQKKYINHKRAALTLLLTFYIMEKRYGLFINRLKSIFKI